MGTPYHNPGTGHEPSAFEVRVRRTGSEQPRTRGPRSPSTALMSCNTLAVITHLVDEATDICIFMAMAAP